MFDTLALAAPEFPELTAPPGPEAISALSRLDPAEVDLGSRVDLLRAWERQLSWVAARQAEVLAVLGEPSEDDWTREEVSAALRLSAGTAQRRLDVARALISRLPDTREALTAGSVSYLQAAEIAEATEPLPAAAGAAVERQVLARASDQTLAELRRAVRRSVLAVDPRSATERHAKATEDRSVRMWPLSDGMAVVEAQLTAAGAATLMTALDALAVRRQPEDDRGVDARRADALVSLAENALRDPDLPRQHGSRAQVSVSVSLETLLGLTGSPAELTGFGPVGAEVARALAADGDWRWLLHDEAGRLLTLSTQRYFPSAELTRYLLARDQVCCFPGCNVPARRCDIDHAVPFEQGGRTDARNCGCLCRRHHRLKHEGGWSLERHPDESCTWTSPAGKTYTVRPPSHIPDG